MDYVSFLAAKIRRANNGGAKHKGSSEITQSKRFEFVVGFIGAALMTFSYFFLGVNFKLHLRSKIE